MTLVKVFDVKTQYDTGCDNAGRTPLNNEIGCSVTESKEY